MTILKWTAEDQKKIKTWQLELLNKINTSGDDKLIANAAYDPKLTCRPGQAPYLWGYTDWDIWLFIAGRGSGKTHAGVQWVLHRIKEDLQDENITVLCPDHNAVVKVMIKGPAGFLANAPKWMNAEWRQSESLLTFECNNRKHQVWFFSSESPEKIRGQNATASLMDEVAAYKSVTSGQYWEEIEQVMLSTREGVRPQVVVTTTPKTFKWLADQLAAARHDPKILVTSGTSFENLENVGGVMLSHINKMDTNSDRYKMEVLGEIVLTEGQKWVEEKWIRVWNTLKPLPRFERVIVVVDTAFEEKNIKKNDPTGILIAGLYFCPEIKDWCFMILDIMIVYLSTPDLIDLLEDVWKTKYGGDFKRLPDKMAIESNASGKPVIQFLNKRGVPAEKFETENKSKTARFASITPMIEERHLCVMGDLRERYAPWIMVYVDKVCLYPTVPPDENGECHDEETDLTSMLFIIAQRGNWVDIKYADRPRYDPHEEDNSQDSVDYEGNIYAQ